jgi:hypothetical protein
MVTQAQVMGGVIAAGGLAALYFGARNADAIVETAAKFVGVRGIRNNNPGNIDWITDPAKRWDGMIRKETAAEGGRFGVFVTAQKGVRAIGQELLLDVRRGVRSVRGLIQNWAPPGENNTSAYASAVAKPLGVAPEQDIDIRAKLPLIVAGIIKHENGVQPYAMADLQRWVYS